MKSGSLLRNTALFGALVLGACTDANEALTIVQAQVPDETCKINEDATGGDRRVEGVLDVGLDKAYGYDLFPLVSNNLIPLATAGGIEPNRVTINGVTVTIEPPAGLNVAWPEGCGPTFEDASNATIAPGGRRALAVTALRPCHAQAIRNLFLGGTLNSSLAEKIKFRAVVRAKGRHGGTGITSDPFDFPIRVCYGCLQTGFVGAYAEFSYALSPPKVVACDKMSENPYPGNPCNPAQDFGPILCCAQDDKGEKLVCPGIPAAPSTP